MIDRTKERGDREKKRERARKRKRLVTVLKLNDDNFKIFPYMSRRLALTRSAVTKSTARQRWNTANYVHILKVLTKHFSDATFNHTVDIRLLDGLPGFARIPKRKINQEFLLRCNWIF